LISRLAGWKSPLKSGLGLGQQLAEVTAVAEHQVADDDQAPAIQLQANISG